MTAELSRNEDRASRVTQAADWFMRLREDEITESVLTQWFAWCEDPDNLNEFHAVSLMWRGSVEERIDPRLAPDGGAPAPNDRVLPTFSSSPKTRSQSRFTRFGYWLGAGCAVVLLGGGLLVLSRHGPQRVNVSAESRVRASELPDGTQLVLAPHTAVAIDFSGSRRSLTMTGGEAFFKVHADKQRPFVVAAGDLTVTAVGTEFDVRSEADQVVIVVQEGTVAVTQAHIGGSWRVAGGYQMAFDGATHSSTISAVDAERILAWRTGRLEYLSEDLATVIADINRYSSPAIELGDPHLSKMKYSGTVDTAATRDWLSGLQAAFPVHVVLAQDGHYILINRPQGSDAQPRK